MEIQTKDIIIRPERQRKDLGDLTGLKASILSVGTLINPLVVEEAPEEGPGKFYLIAGERRLTAWRALESEGKVASSIPATLFSHLDPLSRQLIELEENVKRKDLTWQEHVEAVMKLREMKGMPLDKEFAEYLGMQASQVSRIKTVWENREDPKVWQAENFSSAFTICKRNAQRIFSSAKSEINSLLGEFLKEEGVQIDDTEEQNQPRGSEQGGQPQISSGQVESLDRATGNPGQAQGDDLGGLSDLSSRFRVRQGDFLEWAEQYDGEPFNLIHLDFPYGINHDRSKQGGTANFGTYEDSEDIYKTLVRGFLAKQEALVSSSAHCVCWLSLRFEAWTREQFEKAGWSVHLQPFIWHKSDNKGIIADTMCGMRNVGEYALLCTRNRRPVLKNISNIFSSPTTKRFHASEKPQEVLRYLFSALCDEHSRVLDPTCGSGTAIQMALEYGAKEGLGIELSEDFAQKAQTWLEDFRRDWERRINLDLDFSGGQKND